MEHPAAPLSPHPPPAAAALAFGALAFGFPLLGMSAQVLNLPLGLWWTEAFLFFAPAYLVARAWSGRPIESLRLGRPRPVAVLLGLLLGLANYPLTGALEAVVRQWAEARWPEFTKASDVGALLGHVDGWQRVAFVAAVGLAAPIAEESFFRGMFQRAVESRFGAPRGVISAALCFGAIHYEPIGLIARIELGVLFGVLLVWTDTLWASIAAHASNNLVATAIYYSTAHAPEEPPATSAELLRLAAIGIALSAPLLAAAYALRRPRPEPAWTPPGPMRGPLLTWVTSAFAALVVVIGVAAALRR